MIDQKLHLPQQTRAAGLMRSAANGIELMLVGLSRETGADFDRARLRIIGGRCELREAARRVEKTG